MKHHRIETFTGRYPFLGPIIYMLSIQYFCIQWVVAMAWKVPYSWLHNVISDLGNTACGQYGSHFVCSPLHSLMNASFIMLGCTMAAGSLLIYQEFKKSPASLVGFSLMALAGAGTIVVGLFPENTVHALHTGGAFQPFFFGNISLVILGSSLQIPRLLRTVTILTGCIALIAFGLLVTNHYLGLGSGGMERLTAYPQTCWLIIFGSYMSRRHYLSMKRHGRPKFRV